MSKFDYQFYRDVYCGMLDEVLFARFSPTACDVVSMLVGRDLEEASDSAILRALCLETDFLERELRGNGRISDEKLGDYSVSYADEEDSHRVSVESCPVSSEVIASLTRAGLLTRWA